MMKMMKMLHHHHQRIKNRIKIIKIQIVFIHLTANLKVLIWKKRTGKVCQKFGFSMIQISYALPQAANQNRQNLINRKHF